MLLHEVLVLQALQEQAWLQASVWHFSCKTRMQATNAQRNQEVQP